MARALAEIADSFFRPAVNDLVPYEPGKPVEEVQRELGLERVVKLASNEGPYGPVPAAREAIERSTDELNRYPDGGAYRLRAALAERFDLRFEEVAVGAGSDGLVDCLTQAALEHGVGVERETTKPQEAYAAFPAFTRCRYRPGWLPE